jgi:hypothetical protein
MVLVALPEAERISGRDEIGEALALPVVAINTVAAARAMLRCGGIDPTFSEVLEANSSDQDGIGAVET